MKKWFQKLKLWAKIVLHVLFGSITLALPILFVNAEADSIVYIIWIPFVVLEVLFVIWHVQSKHADENNVFVPSSQQQVSVPQKTVAEIGFNHSITFGGNTFVLRYQYKENLCFCANFDYVNLEDEVRFEHNQANEYDENTVEVFVKNKKIGLMYKGDCRDIVLKSIYGTKYNVMAKICKRDSSNEKIAIAVGVYCKQAQ